MRITHVIDTHVHADHISGGRALAERTGSAYALHESAAVTFPFFPSRDGHTPESICLLVTDTTRGVEPWFLLTGDSLFVGSVGRPDLSERVEQSAKDLYWSLQRQILPLPGHSGSLSRTLLGICLWQGNERKADVHFGIRETV